MTIDPKAAELAKAFTEAAAKQEGPSYQGLIDAAHEKATIDHDVKQAYAKLQAHIKGERFVPSLPPQKDAGFDRAFDCDSSIFEQPTPEPERYELPEDETATAKPNGGLSD
jgi:hypothetical protein